MRNPSNVLLLGVALLLAAPRAVQAQCELERFPAGYLGGVSQGRAIVAQPGGPTHAHFFQKGPMGWEPTQAFEIGNFTLFLQPVAAIDGARAIAGCPESDSGPHWLAGRAFVFDLVGGVWAATELVSPTVEDTDFFGASVARDGDVAVVGAPHRGPDGMGDFLPRAHVFEFDGSTWNETAQLTTYGDAIDVDGATIVLGDEGANPGSVHVYERVSGTWTWSARVIGAFSPNFPYLGASVALDGDRLIAGAVSPYSDPGSVFVFRRVPGGWSQVQEIVPSIRHPADHFGASVALDGSTLLVGAPGHYNLPGRIFRFELVGTQFVETSSFGGGLRGIDRVGSALSFDGEDAFIGSAWGWGYLYRLGFEHAVPFCPTTPNSTGAHGALDVEGCDSRSGNRFTLVASELPPGVLARCFLGPSSTQVPYGDGFRCVGAPIHRLAAGTTNAAGVLATEVDFSTTGGHLPPGSTRYFQAFHRDHVGTGVNLTNALSVGITP